VEWPKVPAVFVSRPEHPSYRSQPTLLLLSPFSQTTSASHDFRCRTAPLRSRLCRPTL
jgi:hypothetical protein